ncbi:uncharacterized protein [Watersipora subatra]|uniref:uncharacterized protein n=1 Tax=Watersipora subatra TaxID=2589382 RepID=UPI00355C2923
MCDLTTAVNLALNRPAQQSSTLSSYTADLAVNGGTGDFTHTISSDDDKWWMVNLQAKYSVGRIILYNRNGLPYYYRSAKQSLLISIHPSPEDPSLSSNQWTRIDYRDAAFNATYMYIKETDQPLEVQHLAVYSQLKGSPLSLAEVEVYAAVNLALNRPAQQSSTLNSYTADLAVNGGAGDFTHTLSSDEDKWWIVNLQTKYSVGRIILYNRNEAQYYNRSAKQSLLISTHPSPEDPSLSSNQWTRIDYRDASFNATYIKKIDQPLEVQHLAVYSQLKGSPLSLAEVEVYEPRGRGGRSKASLDLEQLKPRAGYTKTELVEELKVRPSLFFKHCTEKHFLISADKTNKKRRTGIVRTALHLSAKIMEKVKQTMQQKGRCSAEYNYAMNKMTGQSSNAGNAGRAVDGDLSSLSTTETEAGPWWRVDLGQMIVFKEVVVYVKNGNCGSQLCANRLHDVYFLTNKRPTSDAPNGGGTNGWSICSSSLSALGNEYTRRCDSDTINPLARYFSIYSSANTRIELREVEVYGHELPQLNNDLDIIAETVTSSSITLLFLQWNQTMTGGWPPTK